MRRFLNSDFFGLICGCMAIIFAVLILCLPFVYLEGKAKQQILREMHNVEMPWYKAMYVDIQVNQQWVVLERRGE